MEEKKNFILILEREKKRKIYPQIKEFSKLRYKKM